jgi:hypothetical protein
MVQGALCLLIFVWPFVYYYRCIVPGHSFSLAVGNDFDILYYAYKVYLLDLLSSCRFPLWSPSEAAGFPFYSSPFTQAFYPLNLPLAAFYRVAGGYSVFDGQAFTVLGLAIFALGMYLWLGRLTRNRRAALFATLVMTMSFKLGDILRFPNAVHAAAWMPWILYGLTVAAHRPVPGSLLVLSSCLMLLTAGYPYYVYYCLFLVPPYVLLLGWPYARRALGVRICQETSLHNGPPDASQAPPLHRGFLPAAACGGLGALIVCAPYLYKMSRLLDQTVDRSTVSYEYATLHEFGLTDTLGSWFFPPAAQAEGWYYFGMLGVLVLTLWAASALRNASERPDDTRLLVITVVWVSIVTYITYGKHSYLFDLLWNHLPGFARLRAWGRLNIILLPILALCLARAYLFLEEILVQEHDRERRASINRLLRILIIAGVLVIGIQILMLRYRMFNLYWQLHFKDVHGSEALFVLATAAASGLLAAALGLAWWKAYSKRFGLTILLILCIAISASDLRPVGAQQWLSPAPAHLGVRKRLDMTAIMSQSLITPRVNLEDLTVCLNSSFNVGYLENWYFQRYLTFHRRVFASGRFGEVENRAEYQSFRKLMGLDDGSRFFFSLRLPHATIAEFMKDAEETRRVLKPELRVLEYGGDRLLVEVSSEQPLFFSFIDNWDPDWTAQVNGRTVPLKLLFGTFKAVELPAGTNRVLMEYVPFWSGQPLLHGASE